MTQRFESRLRSLVRGEILSGEPLARHTSLRVGGPADIFVAPADVNDLVTLLAVLMPAGIPYLVIGGGYNILVRDGGFRGVVVSLKHLDRLEFMADGCMTAEAGATLQQLVSFSEKQGRQGLEFLAGIPGSLGGAVAVNAGAHGSAILDRVETITTLHQGRTTVQLKEELDYGYRYLKLQHGEIVLAARFRLEEGGRKEIGERIAACLAHRRTAQRVTFPNAGSFFKNPAGHSAWKLIDKAGLRGTTVGGAQVADAHANFLVNRGEATAGDFLELAGLVKEKVRERFGIELEEEVRIVGE